VICSACRIELPFSYPQVDSRGTPKAGFLAFSDLFMPSSFSRIISRSRQQLENSRSGLATEVSRDKAKTQIREPAHESIQAPTIRITARQIRSEVYASPVADNENNRRLVFEHPRFRLYINLTRNSHIYSHL
jgi:hypothetical protein